MRVRHYSGGKFYTIECPQGTEIVRRSGQDDHLIVPLNGKRVRIPADPPELLPLLAETGNFGVSLVGEPKPDVSLAGVACPECGVGDVNWLQLKDATETLRCDCCGGDFVLPSTHVVPIASTGRTGSPARLTRSVRFGETSR